MIRRIRARWRRRRSRPRTLEEWREWQDQAFRDRLRKGGSR